MKQPIQLNVSLLHHQTCQLAVNDTIVVINLQTLHIRLFQ